MRRTLGGNMPPVRLGHNESRVPISKPWLDYHTKIKELVEADLNNKEEPGAW